jgi:uncharacterized protein YijF (DUF1287 family)
MIAMKLTPVVALVLCGLAGAGCDQKQAASRPSLPALIEAPTTSPAARKVNRDWVSPGIPFGLRLAAAAEERATHSVVYDAAYVQIPYPGGDVPPDKGVCSDEVVRAYRLLGIDLQKLVHQDMVRAFQAYPSRWGLPHPDTNIDHRRVPNLATFFTRHGASLPVTAVAADYKPGDVVAFSVADGRPHIGIVTERMSEDGLRPLVMHNIGLGPQIEDVLFTLTLTGHYRYRGPAGR